MALYCKADQIQVGTMDMGNTSFTTKMIYGAKSSFMIAERPAGYHSRPHIHNCEQLNYMQQGELYIYFADGRVFYLKEGDVLRIPPNVVHWSWNKSNKPCILLEVHSPGLQNDPMNTGYAVGLFDKGEEVVFEGRPVNEFVELSSVDIEKVESNSPEGV